MIFRKLSAPAAGADDSDVVSLYTNGLCPWVYEIGVWAVYMK